MSTRTIRFPHLPAAVACLAALVACGDAGPKLTIRREEVHRDGSVTVQVDGISIEVDPSIAYEASVNVVVGDAQASATMSGKSYGVRDGAFWIGDTSYGAVSEGDRVRVGPDGVFVNDERRGDAP